MSDKQHEITLTNLPLNQFKPGQHLEVKFAISSGHEIRCAAEFIAIERGLVKVKILDIYEPSWYHWSELKRKYPDCVGRFRAKNCHLWGQGVGDHWERCYWFKNIKEPAT